MRGILLRACAVALLAAACAAAQEPAQTQPQARMSATRDGDFISVRASVELPVDARLAWDVLTDYESYPRFLSGMTQSRVVARRPEGVVLEQKGELAFLVFSQKVETRLLVAEFPPTTIVARALEGSLRDLVGRYELQPRPGGVRLAYTGRFVPDFPMPPVIGLALVRNALERNFNELAAEILRRAEERKNGTPQ